MKKILIMILLCLLFVSCVEETINEPIACTEEAKVCPDGSSVVRIPPDCEFASCPKAVPNQTEEILEEPPKSIEEPKILTIPSQIENNCIGFYPPFLEEAEAIPNMGGGWVRPHPGPFIWGFIEESKENFNFKLIDKWVEQSEKSNIAILATIFPFAEWDQKECHSKECEVSERDVFYPRGDIGIPKSRCAPCNYDDYKRFLLRLVERYDGDGIDDMPNLQIPIKYYEILNEPDLKTDFLDFFKGTHEEYVEILKVSYETIKSACSDCKIVQGGAAGIDSDMTNYWKKIFELGGGKYFDIANIHYVNHGDTSTLNVKDFKKLLNQNGIDKPIWVTESEFKPEDDIEKSAYGALDAGAEKIFFSALFVNGKEKKMEASKFLDIYKKVLSRCR